LLQQNDQKTHKYLSPPLSYYAAIHLQPRNCNFTLTFDPLGGKLELRSFLHLETFAQILANLHLFVFTSRAHMGKIEKRTNRTHNAADRKATSKQTGK